MQTAKEVIEIDKSLINDDNVQIEIVGDAIEPHPISPYDAHSFGYQTIQKSIRQVFPDTIAVSGCFLASTDTRWYLPFTKSVYRFSPSIMQGKWRFCKLNNHFLNMFKGEKDTSRFHGHNERISVDNYLKTVNFYHHIILNSDKKELELGRPAKDEL